MRFMRVGLSQTMHERGGGMMKSCLLCGVGGQGTVLASRILASAAMEQGWFARTAETIGMAQRGGSVVSHVRFGERVASALIPEGKADVLIAFEPGEGVRNLKYLKRGGTVIVADKAIPPVTASLGKSEYRGGEMVEYLKKHAAKCVIVNPEEAEAVCGTEKALNVALVGAAVSKGGLGLSAEAVERVLTRRIKPAYLEMNQKALRFGMQAEEVNNEDDR